MGKKKIHPNYRRRTLHLPGLDHSKLAVLNSLGSSRESRTGFECNALLTTVILNARP
jgi:hypothetical protein